MASKVNNDINKEAARPLSATERHIAIEEKINELITLVSDTHLDDDEVAQYRSKLDAAFEPKVTPENFKAFEVIDERTDASREQLLDEFSLLLESHKFNSKAANRYLKIERTNKIILMAVGIIMIALGFAMIIMPAPPYFEMFTIFYFSPDNGVTLMDLISLIIVFAGVYVFVRPLYNKRHTAH
jgi:hypothetical protein